MVNSYAAKFLIIWLFIIHVLAGKIFTNSSIVQVLFGYGLLLVI